MMVGIGDEFWIGAVGEVAEVVECREDVHGFPHSYTVQLHESGQLLRLHEERLYHAGVIERTVH